MEIIKMMKKLPKLYSYSKENIKQKIVYLQELGYKKEEILEMTSVMPQIYCLHIDTITEKLNVMMENGYAKEEVLEITKYFPHILGASIENIMEKLGYYNEIGLHEIPIVNPKTLMQSISLTHARIKFYEEKGIEIEHTNYIKVFVGQKQFKKQYKITNEELIEKYNYEKDKVKSYR